MKKLRRMYATEQFFTHPGVVEELIRDEGALRHFTAEVVVVPAADYAALLADREALKADFRDAMQGQLERDRELARVAAVAAGAAPSLLRADEAEGIPLWEWIEATAKKHGPLRIDLSPELLEHLRVGIARGFEFPLELPNKTRVHFVMETYPWRRSREGLIEPPFTAGPVSRPNPAYIAAPYEVIKFRLDRKWYGLAVVDRATKRVVPYKPVTIVTWGAPLRE